MQVVAQMQLSLDIHVTGEPPARGERAAPAFPPVVVVNAGNWYQACDGSRTLALRSAHRMCRLLCVFQA